MTAKPDPILSTRSVKTSLLELAPDYQLVIRLFLSLLGLIYIAAFWSLSGQIEGLAGSQGIFPIEQRQAADLARWGDQAWWRVPSLFWLANSDEVLRAATWLGIIFGALLVLGIRRRLSLIVLFGLYLSLFHAGGLFINFQWDYLLLEAGFLAIFLEDGPRLTIWLMRWLLFRLRFQSGLSKLVSQDASWADLSALSHYFETQPLPHLGAWYAHQLPDWLLRFGAGATLFVELAVPFFFLLPRRWRLWGAGITATWQILIIATSNHNFFNLLTLALCLFLLDDRAVRAVLPFLSKFGGGLARSPAFLPRLGAIASALVALPIGLVLTWQLVTQQPLPDLAKTLMQPIYGWRLVNQYHVFPTINVRRIELQIEGSIDGRDWRPYVFKHKVDDPARTPGWVVPHQPRLDWMIWFVPLSPRFLDWFDRFLERLQQGSPQVLALLETNPFPGQPPRLLRITAYHYRFATRDEHANDGVWWVRESLGPFAMLPGRTR